MIPRRFATTKKYLEPRGGGRLLRANGSRSASRFGTTLTRQGRDLHESHHDEEAGAVLILAMVFLVVVSLIIAGLLTFSGSSLTASASFTSEQSIESAATSAVNLAIQESRITFASQMENAYGGQTTPSAQPSACWFNSTGQPLQPPPINNVQIDVWCSMTWQPFSANTRTVTYSACLSTISNVQCAATPLLQAVEIYDDYPPGVGVPLVNPVQCNFYNYCGQSTTQLSWQWNPTVPTVTSISPTSTSIAGGAAMTITGTGFLPGSSVNLTEESGGVPSSNNVVVTVPSTQVTASNCTGQNGTCTTLSLTTPPVTSGIPSQSFAASYFVTVNTAGGTSQFVQPGGILSYTAFRPTVSGISGTEESLGVPGGSITGDASVTITGTGFISTSNFAAQVWFVCDTATNTACPVGSAPLQASDVNVTSSTSLTAVTPAVTVAGNWYVQVDTFGGASIQTSYDFNYGVQVPIIISMSPTSAVAGGQIIITGSNFLAGSTVALYLDQNGSQSGSAIPASVSASPTITPSSMTFIVPASGLTPNAQYFPVITLPSVPGYSGPTSSQPYNEPADTFTFTSVTPTVNVTYPVNGDTYGGFGNFGGFGGQWSGTITGTAASSSAGTISSAAVAIENTSTGKWWNGTAFSASSQTFLTATGTTSWSYTLASTKLIANDSYTVTGEATDSLNNTGTSSSASFTYG